MRFTPEQVRKKVDEAVMRTRRESVDQVIGLDNVLAKTRAELVKAVNRQSTCVFFGILIGTAFATALWAYDPAGATDIHNAVVKLLQH